MRLPGPRPAKNEKDPRGGGFQFAALAAEVKIRIPRDWRGENVLIAWKPTVEGEVLEYLFAPEADPLPSIDATDSAVVGAEPAYTKIDRAPDWLEQGSVIVQVPMFAGVETLLVLKPSEPGRVKVRQAEAP